MHFLTEDRVKALLREAGLPVPKGEKAETPEAARRIAAALGGAAIVKALVPTGRRGKANAVRLAADPDEAGIIAAELIGTEINGHRCHAVYVEEKVEVAEELYLSFVLEDYPPRVLASVRGGVDIETVHRDDPAAIQTDVIDPLRGLTPWDAVDLWERAGLADGKLPGLARLTADLHQVFVRHDGTTLELNPVALDVEGRPHLVGAMMATENEALAVEAEEEPRTDREQREARVRAASRDLPGGMVRYTELDGDIGTFVGGGGAGLHQHDLILAAGGSPANHTDASTQNPDKVRALIDVILDNPNVRSLFISWHYQQMAQIDKRVIPAIEALEARRIDPRTFPVVIRMFGQGEDAARAVAARLPGVHYLPHGAPMSEGIDMIVRLTAAARQRASQPVEV